MFKLSHLSPAWLANHSVEELQRPGGTNGEWVEHRYPPIFAKQKLPGERSKILATAPGGDPNVFRRLAESVQSPFFLLYLLHTPRGEGEAGRYQSRELRRQDVVAFLNRFENFLRGDARHDIWIHSAPDQATIVWDRHNLIHAYGPIETYAEVLVGLGFGDGSPAIPVPHIHHYREEFDQDAQAVLEAIPWHHSPLRPGDEQ